MAYVATAAHETTITQVQIIRYLPLSFGRGSVTQTIGAPHRGQG